MQMNCIKVVACAGFLVFCLPSPALEHDSQVAIERAADPSSRGVTFDSSKGGPDSESKSLKMLYRASAKKAPEDWSKKRRDQIKEIFKQYVSMKTLAALDLKSPRCSDEWAAQMLSPSGDGDNRLVKPTRSIALKRVMDLREALIWLTDRECVNELDKNTIHFDQSPI